MKSHRWMAIAGAVIALGTAGVAAAQSIHCESRDYRRNYCATGRISGAQIISQTSNAPCIEGRTWGFDGNGIWVNNGCAGDFAFQGGFGPPPRPPGGAGLTCESRDYQRNFCDAGVRISNAWVARQRSQAACIQGRTWGWENRGIWVTSGCAADFAFTAAGGPPPRPPGGSGVACESRNYQQSWCDTGARISRAWVAEQRSQAPCIQGQTWGWRDRGIWVSGGCSAIFAFEGR